MPLDTIDRDLGMSKGRVQTTINQDSDSISSDEEALRPQPPDNRIGVTRTTQVQVSEEQSRSFYDARTSDSSHRNMHV